MRAKLGELLSADQRLALGSCDLDGFVDFLAETGYGEEFRWQHRQQTQWNADLLTRGILSLTSHRLAQILRLAKGKAAIGALVLALPSDLRWGSWMLGFYAGAFRQPPFVPCWGVIPLDRWLEMANLDSATCARMLMDRSDPISSALVDSLLLLRSQGLAQAERHFSRQILTAAQQFAELSGQLATYGQVVSVFLDSWNFRLWRYNRRKNLQLDWLPLFGNLREEKLRSSKDEAVLFQGSGYHFERPLENQDTAREIERLGCAKLENLNRLDPMEAGLFVSTWSRILSEGDFLLQLVWRYES